MGYIPTVAIGLWTCAVLSLTMLSPYLTVLLESILYGVRRSLPYWGTQSGKMTVKNTGTQTITSFSATEHQVGLIPMSVTVPTPIKAGATVSGTARTYVSGAQGTYICVEASYATGSFLGICGDIYGI